MQHCYAWRYVVGFVHFVSGHTFAVELAAFTRQVAAGPRTQMVLALD